MLVGTLQNSEISPVLVFLVIVFHFSQNWSFNFPILACLTLPKSPSKVTQCNTVLYYSVTMETFKILFMKFLQFM